MKKDDRILREFDEVVNQSFGRHLKNIILFGSRARGDHTTDSDYDCLLIFDDVSRELIDAIDDVAADFLYRYNVVISAFPVSEESYKKHKYNPLYMNVRSDGIAL
jgi:predicted nucleotidyltransferase